MKNFLFASKSLKSMKKVVGSGVMDPDPDPLDRGTDPKY
jgi:hypothetical protein